MLRVSPSIDGSKRREVRQVSSISLFEVNDRAGNFVRHFGATAGSILSSHRTRLRALSLA
jgi:hypothetical protein